VTSTLLPDQQPSHLQEVTLRSETVLQGHFLHAKRDTVRLPDGSTSIREFIVHPGAVMIIPLLDDGRVVVERQYRYPLQRAMIEFPAGKLDPGEDVWVCAQRELWEETGYLAAEWARAGVLHPVIAYATEFIDIWFARGLTLQERRLDDGEFLDVLAVESMALLEACRDGTVTDAKTLTGMLWLQNVLRGDWSLTWQTSTGSVQPVVSSRP
jgi:ADP-ribose pyrophosphatase